MPSLKSRIRNRVKTVLDRWVIDRFHQLYYEATDTWDPVRAGQQLRVVWRTHRVDGQFALEERDFFAKHLP